MTAPKNSKRPEPSAAKSVPPMSAERARPWLLRLGVGLKVLVGMALVLGLSLAVAMGARRYMRESPRFAVLRIEVTGNQRQTPEFIAALAGIELGDNAFALDVEEAKRKIESCPWIESAVVTRKLPGSVQITVVEHEERAIVAIDEHLFLASSEGVVFKELEPGDPSDLPLITGIDVKDVSDRERVKARVGKAIEILSAVEEENLRYPLQEVHLEDDGNASIVVGVEGIAIALGAPPYRLKIERAARALSEISMRKAKPSIVFVDNESSPERVVVRLDGVAK